MLCSNWALWLDVASHVTSFSQSACVISVLRTYAMPKLCLTLQTWSMETCSMCRWEELKTLILVKPYSNDFAAKTSGSGIDEFWTHDAKPSFEPCAEWNNGTSMTILLPRLLFKYLTIYNIEHLMGPWWWSSGQHARLLFLWSKFESRWSRQFICLIVLEKNETNKRGRGCPIFFKKTIENLPYIIRNLPKYVQNFA